MIGLSACAQNHVFDGDYPTPDHKQWSDLLMTHVDSAGWISYKGFVDDSTKLNAYLRSLSSFPPNSKWSEEEKLAYWINVYNAFTIKLIVDYYPVSSIKEIKKGVPFINSVWDIEFFEIGGEKVSLNEIEHTILRKDFDEPRIHFAIVCASKSCPKLLNKAYDSENLEEQLVLQTKMFLNDSSKNVIEEKQVELSSIFKWFSKDFTQHGSIKDFIEPYVNQPFSKSAKVKYLEYDWSLNGE